MPFEELIQRLLKCTGDDSNREGLKDTPARVSRAYREWFSGYGSDVSSLLRVFEDGAEGCDEMVSVCNIPVYSHCEHHMAPFFGLAHIGYVPAQRILGLSKFARVVEVFARRLQVQERMTNQIATALFEGLEPLGVGVMLECRHLCMESRGVGVRGCITTTTALRGVLRTDSAARSEFLSMVKTASQAREGV
jgi:GTP cyclohydrolase I